MAVYAPRSTVVFNSSGGCGVDFYGALVGRDISFGGGSRFHVDEALRNLHTSLARITGWHEIRSGPVS